MPRIKDLAGQKFGRLLVIEKADRPIGIKNKSVYWMCLCDCGKEKIINSSGLLQGNTTSCGCYQKEQVSKIFNDNIESKTCSQCHTEKAIQCFGKCNKSKDGHKSSCKDCRKIEYKNNRDEIRKQQREYYIENAEKIKNKVNEYRLNNPDVIKSRKKIYYYKNREKLLEISKQYQIENSENLISKKATYRKLHKKERNAKEKVRRDSDVQYRLLINLRTRLRQALIKNEKSGHTLDLLNCSIAFLREYVESKFDENMSWDNYGSYWEIDHIIPCRAFNLTIPEEQALCFNYKNLQPMESNQNHSKQDLLPNGEKARNVYKQR